MYWKLIRHVRFMRICDCRISRIFQQSAQIAYFSAQIGIFDGSFNIINVSTTYLY